MDNKLNTLKRHLETNKADEQMAIHFINTLARMGHESFQDDICGFLYTLLVWGNEGAKKALKEQIQLLRNQAKNLASDHYKELVRQWREKGGCDRCRGRGWVVTWDTLDSLSGCYHEHGPCPEKDCTASTLGRNPSPRYNNKYDNFHGSKVNTPLPSEIAENIRKIEESVGKLERLFIELRHAKEVERGKVVKVVRGRKVPVGTVGEVFWVGESRWGYRVGLKDGEGNKHFTAETNVEVVLNPETLEEHKDEAQEQDNGVSEASDEQLVNFLKAHADSDELSQWEKGFALSVSGYFSDNNRISTKQRRIVERIVSEKLDNKWDADNEPASVPAPVEFEDDLEPF